MRSLFLAALLAAASPTSAQSPPPPELERRVESILERMTWAEKIGLLGGNGAMDVAGIPRLGVPTLTLADGPFGLRRYSRANVMAGGIALAATWNTNLAGLLKTEWGFRGILMSDIGMRPTTRSPPRKAVSIWKCRRQNSSTPPRSSP